MERFKTIIVVGLTLLLGIHFELYAGHLPYREELRSDIKFWKKVFCETSSDQYIIHDSQYLSIIYTVITFEPKVSERMRSKYLKQIKDKYEKLLLKLHYSQGDTSDRSDWERRVFNHFKMINEKDKFRIAARRIRAQQGIKEKFVRGLERSFSYLPLMVEIFKRHNLPPELIYMPHIESSFNINAASKAGAKGMWQFIWSTGRYYLRINRIVDQRFDPIYSSEAAAKLLKRNYKDLQDWALAVTAYNHGLAGMKRAKRKFNGGYLEIREKYLKRSFGFASKNFYPEFLAVVEIMDSLQYYFPLIKHYPDYVFKEITVKKSVNVPRLAKHLQLDINELKKLNPSFKNAVWKGQRRINKGYSIRFPIEVDQEKVLAFVSIDNEPVNKVLLSNEHNQQDLKLPKYSFSKISVENSEVNLDVLFDFMSVNKTEVESVNGTVDLSSLNKPSVKLDLEVGKVLPNFDEIYQNDDSVIKPNSDLLAVVFAKPNVISDRANINTYQFNYHAAKFASDSKIEIETKDENHFFYANAGNKAREYTLVSNNNVNISIAEIKRILENRLKISRNGIIVFPNETLGHFAEWLNLSAAYIRSLNNLSYGQKIYSGQRLRIDFSFVSRDEFTEARLKYHMDLINKLLNGKHGIKLVDYTVNPGENLWKISQERNNFPVNLLLYFNDLNKLEQLYPGDIIKLPII